MIEQHSNIELEAGRILFAQQSSFITSVARLTQLPDATMPEIAFAGRSNVGKSSLINALTGRQSLARTSSTPGRTQQVNLFDLGKRLCLADLPGYGYAKAPKEQVERWTKLVFAYLRGRSCLMRVCLLIDARHGLKANDLEVMTMLGKAAVAYQLVMTKSDLVPKDELQQRRSEIEQTLSTKLGALRNPALTSSRKQIGIVELRASLAKLALRDADEVRGDER